MLGREKNNDVTESNWRYTQTNGWKISLWRWQLSSDPASTPGPGNSQGEVYCSGTEKGQLRLVKKSEPEKRVAGESMVAQTHTCLPNQEKAFAFYLSMMRREWILSTKPDLCFKRWHWENRFFVFRTRFGRLLQKCNQDMLVVWQREMNGAPGGRVKRTCKELHRRGKGKR